jgi:hypothetical protein
MRAAGFAVVLAAAVLAAAPVRADDNEPSAPSQSVMNRPRPEYDAPGIHVGGFLLKPALDVGVSADSNVFRTPGPVEGDVFYTLRGGFDLQSNWGRHQLDITASIAREQYTAHQEENETDWNVGASGRLDVMRGTEVEGDVSYADQHEPRTSPNEPGGARTPTEYTDLHGEASITHNVGVIGVTEGGTFDRFVYSPTPLIGGGTFNNADRNLDSYAGTMKVAYNASPDYTLFLRGSYGGQTYDQKVDSNGEDRETRTFHADLGADLKVSNLVFGNVFAGYVNERFHAPLRSIAAIEYGASLDWYATPLLTAHFTAARLFDNTTLDGASVSDDQTLGVGLDYEFLRNLILQTHFSFMDSRFVGIARNDEVWEGDIGAKYLFDRNISATATYTFSERLSSAPGQDFNDNLVFGGLHFQL